MWVGLTEGLREWVWGVRAGDSMGGVWYCRYGCVGVWVGLSKVLKEGVKKGLRVCIGVWGLVVLWAGWSGTV